MSVAWNLFSCGLRTGFRRNYQLNVPRLQGSTPALPVTSKAMFSSSSYGPKALRAQLPPVRRTNANITLSAYKFAGITGLGIGIVWALKPTISCEPPPAGPLNSYASTLPLTDPSLPPPPSSQVNLYELTFGTLCGVCAGVFVKKGAKVLAFFLGGVYVLLQYLTSMSFVHVDWNRVSNSFEKHFYTRQPSGIKRPPTIVSLFWFIVDFLTADFQQRASFIAGFALGLRTTYVFFTKMIIGGMYYHTFPPVL